MSDFVTATEILYQFLLVCGKKNDLSDFCKTIAEELNKLIPYDQVTVIFLNTSGKIEGSILYGVQQKHWETFLKCYETDQIGGEYTLKAPLHISIQERVQIINWTDDEKIRKNHTFYEEYVKPLRIKYCLSFCLLDHEECVRCIYTLNRGKKMPFKQEDMLLITRIRPLLENLFAKFLLPAQKSFSEMPFFATEYGLTIRENEIATLICEGVKPSDIAKRLCISISTVYKHIDNIYKKMSISNRQELFARFMK